MEEQGHSPAAKKKKNSMKNVNEKRIVVRVFHCLQRDHPTKTKQHLVDMCSDYTNVGKSTIYRWLREENLYGEVQTPKTSSGRKPLELDEDHKYAIRRTIHGFFFKNELPTLKKVWNAVTEDDSIPKIGKEKLRNVLHGMNFNYGKVNRET